MSTGSMTTRREKVVHLPAPGTYGRQGVDIVVKGRNVEVPDHYRVHIAEKLQKMERFDQRIIEISVELSHERNRRQADHCQRVEITLISRGPVVRGEACSADFYSALDLAMTKITARLRRAADRRRVHRGRRAPVSVAEATAALGNVDAAVPSNARASAASATPRGAVATVEQPVEPLG